MIPGVSTAAESFQEEPKTHAGAHPRASLFSIGEPLEAAEQAFSLLLTAIESKAPDVDRWATVGCALDVLGRAVDALKSARANDDSPTPPSE